MASKRKRGDDVATADVVHRPTPGTKSFPTGKAVRDGLATGTRQGELVSRHVQELTCSTRVVSPTDRDTILVTPSRNYAPYGAHPPALPGYIPHRR